MARGRKQRRQGLAYKQDRAMHASTSHNELGKNEMGIKRHNGASCFIEALKKYNAYGKLQVG